MRPTSLEEYVGQGHLLGPGKLLERALAGGGLPSLILWGPPGTGKTTLARILASGARAHFEPLSAVSAGVKDIRAVVATAATRRDEQSLRTVLFIDEIHRFSKSQQDALLPHVEAGTVTLVGATTENPSFEVNAPLLSRCRVVRLAPLAPDALRQLARRALSDRDRGLGATPAVIDDDVMDQLIEQAGGDARRLLNTLEVAVQIAEPSGQPEQPVRVTRETVEEAAQQKTLIYDKAGAEHYGVVSALIKSLRGSDPDAAAYWMTRMLEAGEDPLFILRRLVIFASEDIGNADPNALSVATAALDAFRFIGLPEGALPMTQAVVYLACAPKSNTALTTYAAARRAVREHGALPVPAKLRNAVTGLDKSEGYGKGYKYPHDFEGNYVPETYLPDELVGQRYYEPSTSGREAVIKDRLDALRARDGED
ncbi:MAG TPA: replication-associated recombination protein A [Kofleriaceae bacterium]|nr:replication-associated recombination protein A [Kofleriaceae bacterium]